MSESIQDAVIADMEARKRVGLATYGTLLEPHNGRDALQDAYEEALDLACYLKQALIERRATLADTTSCLRRSDPPTWTQFPLAK